MSKKTGRSGPDDGVWRKQEGLEDRESVRAEQEETSSAQSSAKWHFPHVRPVAWNLRRGLLRPWEHLLERGGQEG